MQEQWQKSAHVISSYSTKKLQNANQQEVVGLHHHYHSPTITANTKHPSHTCVEGSSHAIIAFSLLYVSTGVDGTVAT